MGKPTNRESDHLRIKNPSDIAKRMARVFKEPSYMSAEEMEAALIALEQLGYQLKKRNDRQIAGR